MRGRLILASASPRRAQLLKGEFRELLILPSDVEERYTAVTPEAIVIQLSELKLSNLPEVYPDIPVLSADTLVWFEGETYGKPKDSPDAFRMLRKLSGNTHEVYTGYALAYKGKIITGCECASVKFKALGEGDIASYISDGSPMDKAGGYGIQDGRVVDSFSGDINAVIGLPVDAVLRSYDILIGGENE